MPSPAGKNSDTATVSLTATPVNDAPAANNDSATVAEGGTVTFLFSKSSSDLPNLPAFPTRRSSDLKLSDPAHGSVTLNADGTFSYSHDGSETTSDSFTYKACDNGTTNGSPDGKCSGKIGRASCRERVKNAAAASNDRTTAEKGSTAH